jgi:alkanesulfonate monooxygenase SsuD/methylene tetrahydromethanopterin reductase-like flavin-dependent oxidoreductase (luciferase family)
VEGRAALQPEMNALSKQDQWTTMAERVDDALVETIAVRGTPEECAREITARFDGVADRVCCYFPGYDIADETIARLVSALAA